MLFFQLNSLEMFFDYSSMEMWNTLILGIVHTDSFLITILLP